MKFIGMILVNCKKYFKNYKNLILMFIVPIACVCFVRFTSNNSLKGLNVNIAVINLDKGSIGAEFTKSLEVKKAFQSREEALEKLKGYDVIALYEIPENFTEEINKKIKPDITVYKIEEGNNTQIFEVQIEKKLNDLLKVNILKDSNIIKDEKDIDKNFVKVKYNKKEGILSSEKFMPIVLIMFYLVTFSTSITGDLLKLRKEKILERFLSTNNKGYEIMGSIYISMWFVQVIMYTASFLVMNSLFKFHFENFGMLILNIALMSLVSISLGVMFSRIFKEASIAMVILTLVSIVMFFLYLGVVMSQGSTKIPAIIVTLGKFTPFYWAMESIENSIVFPNAIVLILIALVFFTAGSIRYSSFAKKV